MNDKVSIIIPAYNSEKYIRETILSALKQTYENIEIIIIDDGSTDRTKDIVMNIKDDRVVYVYQENRGVSEARNKGISISTGKFVAFLDSDDIWEPEKIKKQIQKIEIDNSDSCYCGYKRFYDYNNTEIKNKVKYKKGKIAKDIIKFKIWAQTSCWIIRKEIITKNNLSFTPGCNFGEDIEFLIKNSVKSKITYVDEVLVNYRIVDRGEDDFVGELKGFNTICIWERLIEWIKNNDEEDEYIDIINNYNIPKLVVSTLLHLIKNKDLEKIKYVLKRYDILNKNSFKMINGLRSIKLDLEIKYVRFKLKNII